MRVTPDWAGLRAFVLSRLQKELPHDLSYHGIQHTRDDVLPAIERLAELANLPVHERLALRTGALLHDIGYIERYTQNEILAVGIAREILPGFGYSSAQIETITGIIMATRMPQNPQNVLEQIMCDADLDSLGRKDFFLISYHLLQERRRHGEAITFDEWRRIQIAFLDSHAYFTEYARSQRSVGKARNRSILQKLVQRFEEQKLQTIKVQA